jgi:hypothetical protein
MTSDVYPKRDYWDSQSDEFKIHYLSVLVEAERAYAQRQTEKFNVLRKRHDDLVEWMEENGPIICTYANPGDYDDARTIMHILNGGWDARSLVPNSAGLVPHSHQMARAVALDAERVVDGILDNPAVKRRNRRELEEVQQKIWEVLRRNSADARLWQDLDELFNDLKEEA